MNLDGAEVGEAEGGMLGKAGVREALIGRGGVAAAGAGLVRRGR